MITFAVENLASVRDEIDPLLEEHWREVALYQDRVPLAPIWENYEAVEKQGGLLFITARDGLQLVGYSVWFLKEHMHYAGHKVAANDVIFLASAYRKSRAGIGLIRESERVLKSMGIHRILWHIKPSKDWTPILKRMGYELEEYIMGKYTG